MTGIDKSIAKEFNDESALTRPDPMTDAEYAAAFARMATDYFTAATSAELPQLLYVTGLPGAGKSTYVKNAMSERPELAGFVHINFDDLRIYHPRYARHVAQDPLNAAARIDTAVEGLIGWLSEEAARRHVNVLLDDAAIGAGMTEMILSPFQKQGYAIEAAVIATPSSIARQAVHLRFEENFAVAQRGEPVIPRWVNTAEQDNAPAALVETVETLADKGISGKLSVITRDARVLYEGNASPDASKAVREEMTRELTDPEKTSYQSAAARIAALVNLRMKAIGPSAHQPKP